MKQLSPQAQVQANRRAYAWFFFFLSRAVKFIPAAQTNVMAKRCQNQKMNSGTYTVHE